MAKAAQATKSSGRGAPAASRNVPAVRKNTAVADNIEDLMEQEAGRGLSMKAEDSIVPIVYVLQDQSPQVKKRDPKYVDGAEPGSLFLRGVNKVFDGKTGFLFQPAIFAKDFVEWIPRDNGGGYVGRHDSMPEDATLVEDPKNPNKKSYVRKNGNEIVETRYYYGMLIDEETGERMPVVLAFSSSGHTVARNWMALMKAQKTKSGRPRPAYGCVYRVTTVERSNSAGNWFVINPEFHANIEDIDPALYTEGRDFCQSIEMGTRVAEDPQLLQDADTVRDGVI